MLSVAAAPACLFDADGVDCAARDVGISGSIPALPKAIWYLNGPGRFSRGEFRYSHWLDGDGLIRALSIDSSRITFASRFVRTRKFAAEEAAGRPLFRTFGSTFDGDRLNDRHTGLETPANVNVIRYGGRLLALGEQGQPYEIDPATLATVGPFTAHGAMTPVTPFAAHAKVDIASGELFNFGVAFSPSHPTLTLFRFDARGRLVRRGRIPLDAPRAIHDFALGPTMAAIYASPYVLDLDRVRGGASVAAALSWQPELGSRLLVVRRDSCELVLSAPIGNRYCLHTINCFEDAGTLVVDVIEMPAPVYDAYSVPGLFDRPIAATPVRFHVDIDRGTVTRRELRHSGAPEFPVLDPRDGARDASVFWALDISCAASSASKFFDQLRRFSWDADGVVDTYQAPSGTFLGGEPVVIRGADGATWVMCQLFDAERARSGFAIFDAFELRRGPAAHLWLDAPSPMAFHGALVAATDERPV